MEETDVKRDLDTDEKGEMLPLVLEIMPGQAGMGLIDIFKPGSYEAKKLRELCYETMSKKDWSLEERQVAEDIKRQLEGGMLLSKGRAIDDMAMGYAVLERTEEGEEYFYVPVRAIKPQEGGALSKEGFLHRKENSMSPVMSCIIWSLIY